MPAGTLASPDPFQGGSDQANAQSPTLANGLVLGAGHTLTFAVTGEVRNFTDAECPTASCAMHLADGDGSITYHFAGAEHGKSNVLAPLNALLGVFLGAGVLDPLSPPLTLDFGPTSGGGLGLDFSSLAPELYQVFFIGDGLADGGIRQEFLVPEGATQLFLGTMDRFEWNNNIGAFLIDITDHPIPAPEPASLTLLGAGLAALRLRRRRSR